jgi:hypothetical protein
MEGLFNVQCASFAENIVMSLNPLNAKLKPIYHLLALLGAHPILHISGVRVNMA